MMKKTWLTLVMMLMLISHSLLAKDIKPGPWKFILKTTNAEIPFIIEFFYDKKNVITGKLYNGKETIQLNEITQNDGVLKIALGTFDLGLELTPQEENTLTGYLIRYNKNPWQKFNVVAVAGVKDRYIIPKDKPWIDLTGIWSFVLEDEQKQKTPAIGTFVQKGATFTGSILTTTGDYRYIDGYVRENTFEGASFDGVYNYVFRGAVKDGRLEGAILSNLRSKVAGSLDPKAELPDAYQQTEITDLNFMFPDTKGQLVSLNHKKFKNKPVVVQIYGSWCPNCLDEMNFLIPWYQLNKKRGVEVVALAFERSLSPEDATKQLLKVQTKLKVPYTILQAGSTSEDKPGDKLPGLKNFISFPTTIFLNKKHKVVKVHAGFSGPSTGDFFKTWKKEFNQTVDQLLK